MEHRQWVSRYREEIKGLAILWIVFFHTRLYLPGGFDLLRALGYGGVDIFLFIMGMGLHRSLSRQPELRGYLGRRFARILPAYLPVLLLSGCAGSWPGLSKPIAIAPKLPPLPDSARQTTPPAWCLPTCSSGLTMRRENWQQRLTKRVPEDWGVKPAMGQSREAENKSPH